MKLNLAAGTDLRPPPWVNLDAVKRWPGTERGCDVIWEAHQPIPFGDETADEIYAGYLFLHVEPARHEGLMEEIRRVLRRGCALVVGEVDMEILLPRWLANPSDKYLSGLVWGEQGDVHGRDLAQWDKHNQGFTEGSLRALLARHGFQHVERVNIHHPDVFYELTLVATKD